MSSSLSRLARCERRLQNTHKCLASRRTRFSSLASRNWQLQKQQTAEAVLRQTAATTPARFRTFVERWVGADDDELYEARGQTLRARGDYPGLGEAARRDERPAWAGGLEAAAPAIRAEYEAAALRGGHEPFFGGDYGEQYDGVPLAAGGARRARSFSGTVAALATVLSAEGEGFDGAMHIGGTRLAFFARQGPRSNVAPHSDLCNYLLTAHLGLIVPGGCSLFFMGGAPPVAWEAGALAPLLQTSFTHAAVNDSDEARVILYFDFFHPDLDAAVRAALQLFERTRKADEAAFFADAPADDAPPPWGDDAPPPWGDDAPPPELLARLAPRR
ncbi:peptide-aspartate beta-dioxygenase [Aureococcus anophagefferens]|nr:peptide-aspartate beta-dioxygenase [Aureococcus anophagefferens]